MRLKASSAKWWPFCLGLNVLTLTNTDFGAIEITYKNEKNHTFIVIEFSLQN